MVRLSALPPIGLFAALQFLTRVPIGLRAAPRRTTMIVWFPVVGAIVGAVTGGIAAGLWHLTPPLVAGGVAVTAGLLVTGAFHEDGLADVADAFAGGVTVERRLEILEDPRHGTYGVGAICASVVVRIAALGSMPGPASLLASCVAAHATARAAAVCLMAAVPPVGLGLGADYGRSTSRAVAAAALLIAAALTALLTGWWAAPVLAVAVLATAAVGGLAVRKIGGISGDVLGACEQVAECGCLVVLSGLAVHHPLWWG